MDIFGREAQRLPAGNKSMEIIGLAIGCILFLLGLSFYKKAWRDFVENKNVGTKEKIFLGVLNFFAALGARGDSYVFLGTFLCVIGLIFIFVSRA